MDNLKHYREHNTLYLKEWANYIKPHSLSDSKIKSIILDLHYVTEYGKEYSIDTSLDVVLIEAAREIDHLRSKIKEYEKLQKIIDVAMQTK